MQEPDQNPRSGLWTFSHASPVPTKSGRRMDAALRGDLISNLRFYGTTRTADIDQAQLASLEAKQWLSADLCTFLCYEAGNRYLEAGPGRAEDLVVLHSTTWDFWLWTDGTPKKVRLPGALPVLEHKYIAFPGNDTNTHFFLCIIVNASDLLVETNPSGPVRTAVLILNSLKHMPPKNPEEKVKTIITCLADGRPLREKDLDHVEVHQPLVRILSKAALYYLHRSIPS